MLTNCRQNTERSLGFNFLPKVKIDVAIADDQLDEVIDVISKAAYTGKIGDGKIFVAELQRVIRIRTGEADEAAL